LDLSYRIDLLRLRRSSCFSARGFIECIYRVNLLCDYLIINYSEKNVGMWECGNVTSRHRKNLSFKEGGRRGKRSFPYSLTQTSKNLL
jgi:hypothetical protein